MAQRIPQAGVDATRSFYDRISAVYDVLSDASERDARNRGLELLDLGEGRRVLELGFGTGHALEILARSVGPRGSVVGIDISEGMRRVAERRLEKAGLAARVELHSAAVPPLPFEDRTFDAVFASFTLELFPADVLPEVLAEVRRVLRQDGKLGLVCMAVPPPGERDGLIERTYKWMHRHFPHIVDCRPIDVDRVLQSAGFRITARAPLRIWSLHVMAVAANPA